MSTMKLDSPKAPFDKKFCPHDANTFIWNTETSCFKYFKHTSNFAAFVSRGSLTVLMTRLVVSCCPTAFSDSSWWSATWTTNNAERKPWSLNSFVGSWPMIFHHMGIVCTVSIQIITACLLVHHAMLFWLHRAIIHSNHHFQRYDMNMKKLGGQHRFTATQKEGVEHENMSTCSIVDHGEFPKLPALTPGWRQSGGTWSSRGEGLTCWTMESLLVDWCDQTNDVVNALKLGLAVTSNCLVKIWYNSSTFKVECSFKTNTTHYCAQLMLWHDMGRYDQIAQQWKKIKGNIQQQQQPRLTPQSFNCDM